MGSWWAYYELGWGGWWFWDPVENASFMPWLVGTALIHSLAVSEKRGAFKSWTVLLAIIAFSLSLLGTFLVRSGVLTSVHAFASDPARGQFILGLLGITMVGSLSVYALKVPNIKSQAEHQLFSRETFLLINNVLLVVAWITVMLGTLYPLVLDFMGAAKLSIGPPYFNAMFTPIMSVLAVVLGFGVVARWKKNSLSYLLQQLRVAACLSVLAALIVPLLVLGEFHIGVFLGVTLSFWVFGVTVSDLWQKIENSQGRWFGLKKLSRSYFGMVLGHVGFAMTILGVTIVSLQSQERDVRMAPGDRAEVAGYTFIFHELVAYQGPNYSSDMAIIKVAKNGREVAELRPEKRLYFSQAASPMTEAGIDAGHF